MTTQKTLKQLFTFEDLGADATATKAYKTIEKSLNKAGVGVIATDKGTISATLKTKRVDNYSYREMLVTCVDSQAIKLRIKQDGNIYQVLINGKLLPIANQEDHNKALSEIIGALNAGRAKFQQALAKAMSNAALPIKKSETSRKDQIVLLTQQRDDLVTAIEEGHKQIAEFESDLKQAA